MEFETCYNPLCPQRETCTHWHNALQEIEQKALLLSIVNPKRIEEAGGYEHCPFYHEYKLRRYARGLVWSYSSMTVGQQAAVRQALKHKYGYNGVVRMRCGYEAITPEDQADIAAIFESLAPGIKPEYKSFEEHYTKPPRVEAKAAKQVLK